MFLTDHRLLVMNIDFPTSTRSLKLWLMKGRPKEPKKRRNFNVLRDDPEKRQELTDKIEEHLESVNLKDINVDTLNEGIVEAVRTSADEVCPFEEMLKKKEPWQDQTLLDLNNKLKKCKDPKSVKKLQKEVKECRKRLKNDYFRNLADGINSVAGKSIRNLHWQKSTLQ